MRGMSYNMHSGPIDDNPGPEQHDRNNYRGSQSHTPGRYQGRSQYPQKQIFPLLQRMRHGDGPEHNPYSSHNYYENQAPQCHINNMGDVDHRQTPKMPPNQESYKQRPSPWVNPPFEDRSYNKPYSHDVEHTRMPTSNYTGHRPPASDHYGGNAGSALDNSNTFSRSVDDTVNIVRKRLLSRESQNSSDNPPPNLTETESKHIETIIDGYSNVRQEHTPKKKIQKQTNVKSNCDQIKNKIVHQLFMMDKDKIHKLMDNPNSSTKFEYAISSLVTESQNSFNRHLRSVAEKSLCGSSTDFINNENNTIYEDTFMKEMQGLLDPQDTVLLEDIKPMVLAELNKVLQLDDFQQRYEEEEQATYPSRDGEYGSYNYENYASAKSFNSFEGNTFYDPNMEQENYDTSGTQSYGNDSNRDHDSVKNEFDNSHLYGRREKRKSSDYNQRRLSTENQQHRRDRKSIDNMDEDKFRRSATPVVPLFDSNADQLSDEEDPFAELDRQYHVAVDHNFIATDDMASPPSISRICTSPVASNNVLHTPQENPFKETPEKSPFKLIPELETPEKVSFNIKKEVSSESKSLYIIKQEIDNQLQSIAKSPLTFSSKIKIRKLSESEPIKTNLTEQSLLCSEAMADETCTPNTATNIKEISPVENTTMKQNKPESKPTEDTDKSESSSCLIKSSAASSSRKRSVDQRPAHRKEKRKKSEPSLSESSKQILNKNIIINVNDCASKTSEKCDTPKSIFNLFFAKEKSAKEAPKEVKKIESDDKGYSEKYVKRKEQRTKSKEIDTEAKKKHDSNSSSHSILSPNSNASSQTPTKPEGQTTLKPIDMFEDLKRKSNVHHARRNTAPTPAPNKAVAEIKFKPLVTSRKISRRHIATQVSRKCVAKETQTTEPKCPLPRFNQNEGRKFVTTAVQTDPVSFKTNINSTDTFERMKEIDLEIQALLQEKFKLYNSLESKETCSSTMQSLGMAVFPLDDKKETETVGDSLSEDAIVDNFTNIPVEELEQIAFESITDEQDDILNTAKPNRRLKVVRQDDTRSSVSPATSTTSTRRKRKGKSPNISLIEQIITDDRPLEDIISLDDLELPPTKSKKKPARPKPKKKAPVKSKANKPVRRVLNYDIKECSVVLTRKDFSKYLTPNMEESKVTEICDEAGSLAETVDAAQSQPIVIQEESNFVEETVVNDIQFDMLDVSEDIIIGDSVELKFSEEKDTTDLSVVISEEIILDNSQSSIEDAGADPPNDDNVCKTYDYSADESLRRDSITVTGNADAVLAIEVSFQNYFFLVDCSFYLIVHHYIV